MLVKISLKDKQPFVYLYDQIELQPNQIVVIGLYSLSIRGLGWVQVEKGTYLRLPAVESSPLLQSFFIYYDRAMA